MTIALAGYYCSSRHLTPSPLPLPDTPLFPSIYASLRPPKPKKKQDDSCLTAYDSLKLGKKHRFIIYGLTPDLKNITVLKQATLAEGEDWESFTGELPEGECRWAVYDMEYDLGEGKRNKLVFVMW